MGDWKANSMHGYGEFLWTDGKKYKGYYVDDKKNGFGMYLWSEPIRVYIGFWRDGKQHGIGKYISPNKERFGLWANGNRLKWYENKEEAFYELDNSERKFISFMNGEVEYVVKILLNT